MLVEMKEDHIPVVTALYRFFIDIALGMFLNTPPVHICFYFDKQMSLL